MLTIISGENWKAHVPEGAILFPESTALMPKEQFKIGLELAQNASNEDVTVVTYNTNVWMGIRIASLRNPLLDNQIEYVFDNGNGVETPQMKSGRFDIIPDDFFDELFNDCLDEFLG